jgi:hypothetical protein
VKKLKTLIIGVRNRVTHGSAHEDVLSFCAGCEASDCSEVKLSRVAMSTSSAGASSESEPTARVNGTIATAPTMKANNFPPRSAAPRCAYCPR